MKNELFSLFIILLLCCSCNNVKEKKARENKNDKAYIDKTYVLDSTYEIGDVRRYGVFPDKGIGVHPNLKIDKIDAVLDLAEKGIIISFPKGTYKRSLKIENRKNININVEKTVFTGAILIKESKNIKIKGSLITLNQLYTRSSNNVELGEVIIKTDTLKAENGMRSIGCSIHAGTEKLRINNLEVLDVGSGSKYYSYVKAGLTVHGHNDEPSDIIINNVLIRSSDRHGVYLSGEDINIDTLKVEKFGLGSKDFMKPMEGGKEGEQYNFSGLWIKNCFDSYIENAVVNLNGSKGVYSVNFDFGESFRPFNIGKLTILNPEKNTSITKKTISRTGVIVESLIEK